VQQNIGGFSYKKQALYDGVRGTEFGVLEWSIV